MKKVAILQSSYIPWKGYFDLINSVDEFILFDEVQFTKRDWRNRNAIKTKNGKMWLTIPVKTKGKYHQKIKDVLVSDKNWSDKHWQTIQHHYAKAPAFKSYGERIKSVYQKCKDEEYLSAINFEFMTALCDMLKINTTFTNSSEYQIVEGKTLRLVELCRQAGATHYVSGPSAKNYIDKELFDQSNIELMYFSYDGYAEYGQLYPPFDHRVSVIDLILTLGDEAPKHLKSVSKNTF